MCHASLKSKAKAWCPLPAPYPAAPLSRWLTSADLWALNGPAGEQSLVPYRLALTLGNPWWLRPLLSYPGCRSWILLATSSYCVEGLSPSAPLWHRPRIRMSATLCETSLTAIQPPLPLSTAWWKACGWARRPWAEICPSLLALPLVDLEVLRSVTTLQGDRAATR